ncbi:MarR family transcriptional regulator [Mycetocola tolaasinivorans]|uniref:MarR family transcriptional regulator n=2 Tax=Mycetocola tolaasinivorans TaxID=76635 RepID=A0A3L7A3S7_9MICO|nr:MarR family transcriptional regulator [Mycetocola tolaasinivorans]
MRGRGSGTSTSSIRNTRLRVPAGGADQANAGEMLSPTPVPAYRSGIGPSAANAGLSSRKVASVRSSGACVRLRRSPARMPRSRTPGAGGFMVLLVPHRSSPRYNLTGKLARLPVVFYAGGMPTAANPPIPDPTSLETAQRFRLNVDRLRRSLRRIEIVEELGRTHEAVLSLVFRQGPLSIADLARREQMRPQSMGAVVGDLVTRELVAKQPDPRDGRRDLISLTEAGQTVLDRVNQVRDRDFALILDGDLSAEERDTLHRAVELMERVAFGLDRA